MTSALNHIHMKQFYFISSTSDEKTAHMNCPPLFMCGTFNPIFGKTGNLRYKTSNLCENKIFCMSSVHTGHHFPMKNPGYLEGFNSYF